MSLLPTVELTPPPQPHALTSGARPSNHRVYTRQAQADFESLVTERGGEDWRKKNNVSLDHTHYRGVINLLVCGRKVWRVRPPHVGQIEKADRDKKKMCEARADEIVKKAYNKQPWVQRKKSKKKKKK